MSIQEDTRSYYVFDSFEGFPEFSDFDPKEKQTLYAEPDYNFLRAADRLGTFENTCIMKGFIPETFENVPKNEMFSVVFYDCDLYQPALDTYDFFWSRLLPGGYLVIHDYESDSSGWSGVKKATHEYFDHRQVDITSFWETTMAVVKKPV